MSAPAPGPNGTMNRTERVGQLCACAGVMNGVTKSAIAAASKDLVESMSGSLGIWIARTLSISPSKHNACACGGMVARSLFRTSFARKSAQPPTSASAAMDAKTIDARTHDFDGQDIEYLRHGDKPLLAKVYKPRGEGPFPALVDLHGGAWCLADRNTDKVRHEFLAGRGIVVVSLDWRTAKEGAYPKALADINYAIRWVKLHAKELKTRP